MRLRRPRDFQHLWERGRSWAHPLLVLRAASNGLPVTRIGIIASRKVGKAVVRNRARRLLREAARHLYPQLLPGWDVVLIARPSIVTAGQAQVQEAVEQLCRVAGLWRTAQVDKA